MSDDTKIGRKGTKKYRNIGHIYEGMFPKKMHLQENYPKW